MRWSEEETTVDATSKDDLLAAIERERAGWEALLAEVGEDRMEQPGAAGDWTFKDVVAHLSGWRERTLARFAAARPGEEPAPPPWPAEFDEETDEGLERINGWMYERNKDRSLADVLAESRQQFRQMGEVVAALPEPDLMEPGRFPWMWTEDRPLGPANLSSSFGHLHEEHEPAIRAWLASLDEKT